MFDDYQLDETILEALRAKGFTTPTPIQAASLPHTLGGGDVIGQARTGTGKTLAYALPIAARLIAARGKGRAPRALVLAPTRELALQVTGELVWVAEHLKVVAIYGGTGYSQQARTLKDGADVVVATPGRALDYLNQGVLNLQSVEIAVLDEADEMLSMGFEEDVEALLEATPQARQTLLFSATLPPWAKRLSEQHLRDPMRMNVSTKETVTYTEAAIEAPLRARPSILADVLHAQGAARSIVFTDTKAEVDGLARELAATGIGAEPVHGDLSQPQRERVVARFRRGEVAVLVGTDVAARGLDIPAVDIVVHYRIPREADAYQHRSGRTGRAGRGGTVIIFFGPRERRQLAALERAVNRRFDRLAPPKPEEVREAKLEALLERIEAQPRLDTDVWRGVAERWIAQGNVRAVAGLLAMALGGAAPERSLLTGEEGWVTMKLSGQVANPSQAVRLLKQSGAGELGRIEVSHDGAYADVRPESVERLYDAVLDGVRVSKPSVIRNGSVKGGRRSAKSRSQEQATRK